METDDLEDMPTQKHTHTHTTYSQEVSIDKYFNFMHLPLKEVRVRVTLVSVCLFVCAVLCFCKVNRKCEWANEGMHLLKVNKSSGKNFHSFSSPGIPSEQPGRVKHVVKFTQNPLQSLYLFFIN